MIYGCVFEPLTIHFLGANYLYSCQCLPTSHCLSPGLCCVKKAPGLEFINLVFVCRLLYADALPVVYKQNTLSFYSAESLSKFGSNLLRHHPFQQGALEHLRNVQLRIHDWASYHGQSEVDTELELSLRFLSENACGLSNLSVRFDIPPMSNKPDELLQQICTRAPGQFRALTTFKLDITTIWYSRTQRDLLGIEFYRRASAIEDMLREFVYLPRESRYPPQQFDKMFTDRYHALENMEYA